ncbi:hypothetical protein PILCRDRAFT_82231 [Piloderma croceum F 1598]|uniref:Uncharacterized protein n=1 Tax=Piloderma croceum (strain F 1598) TaxID=765440 RepID=A0A0C3AE20_PILCF|nr:hypothetical protein PILCRDRAFT_82231 [Piloderma croceum F 1598]
MKNTDNFQFDKLKPTLNEKPTYWRLTVPTSEVTQSEELVLSMQGVIVNKDLPPILIKPNEQHQPFIRQSVQLTGFDSKEFQTCINKLQQLHQTFLRQVPEGNMEPLTLGQFRQFDTVEFATRYFTSRRDDPNGTEMPFDQSTDPNGVLARLANNKKYFHGEDNKVLYYALKHVNDKSPPRFFDVDPARFRVGDIVEVQITIAAVPIKNNKFKMISQLRCLALLDGTFTDVSISYQD